MATTKPTQLQLAQAAILLRDPDGGTGNSELPSSLGQAMAELCLYGLFSGGAF